MLHFVLCDDNPRHNQTLSYHLEQLASSLPMPYELALVTTEPQEVLTYAESAAEPTVYLLDLVLEKEQMNGLDLCRGIHERDPKGYIIYVSAYAEYAMDCVQSHAFDFVLKPYTPERLASSLRDVMQEITQRKPEVTLTISAGSLTRVLDQQSILYLQIQREYVTAYLTDTQVTWRESMAQLLPRLQPEWFVRIHKSYAINRMHLVSIDAKTAEVTLKNGAVLPVSRRMLKELQSAVRGI